MDTTKHLEVALAAHDKWLHDESDSRYWPEIAVAALDSNGLLCTEVEREFVEAWFAKGPTIDAPGWARLQVARDALLDERAGKPVEPAAKPDVESEGAADHALKGASSMLEAARLTVDGQAATIAEQAAEIASLKERLAEATSRPENAKAYMLTFDGQNYVVEASSMGGAVKAWRDAMRPEWGDDWEGDEEPDQVALLNDEPVIRAHAAKLDAEQGGQS